MHFPKRFTKFEVVAYLIFVVFFASLYLLSKSAAAQPSLWKEMSAPDSQLATSLSIGVPALLIISTMTAFCLRPPSRLMTRIQPPVRIISDTAASKVAFVLFWIGLAGLGLVRIVIIPSLT
jgi:hypothetical protein